jgi:hypothetical protein
MPVRVKREVLGIKGDECDCGRRASILHCNACGSTRVYARSGRLHTHLDGVQGYVEIQFRCQTCGHLFIQDERQYCDAPPVSTALAKLKIQRLAQAVQQGEYLNPEDSIAAQGLATLLEQTGRTIPDEVKAKLAAVQVPEHPSDFTPPNGLTKAEYDVAERAFRLEWAHKKLNGQDTGMSVEEYIKRKLAGEVFE